MKRLLFLSLIALGMQACSPAFVPIVRTYGYHTPNDYAMIVSTVPDDVTYIGTISIVPNDYTFIRSNDYSLATRILKEQAARAGARYIYIIKSVNTNDGYWWEKDWGEGFIIEAELYY